MYTEKKIITNKTFDFIKNKIISKELETIKII